MNLSRVLIFCALVACAWASAVPNWGFNLENTRHVDVSDLNAGNAASLVKKCDLLTVGRPCATVPVSGDDRQIGYFTITPPTGTDGMITAFYVDTCEVVWQKNLPALLSMPAGTFSRSSPLIVEDEVVACTRTAGSSFCFSLDRFTGALLKRSPILEANPRAVITGSPSFDWKNRRVIIGMSGLEVSDAGNPAYPCCSNRGSVISLNFDSLTLDPEWKTYTIPPELTDFAGATVWGSSPSIDYNLNLVYVGTGQLTHAPFNWQLCVNTTTDQCGTDETCLGNGLRSCNQLYGSPNAHFDSMLGLDLDTGAIRWSMHASDWDTFTTACVLPNAASNPNCPLVPGKDSDFGHAPIVADIDKPTTWSGWQKWYGELVRLKFNKIFGSDLPYVPACLTPGGQFNPSGLRHLGWFRSQILKWFEFIQWLSDPKLKVAIAGQKAGILWTVDREFGKVLWGNPLVPWGYRGGFQWGESFDKDKNIVYFQNTDEDRSTTVPGSKPTFLLFPGTSNNATCSAGSVGAYNPTTNLVVWHHCHPDEFTANRRLAEYAGPVTSTGDLVILGSSAGTVDVRKASTGELLYQNNPHAGAVGGGCTPADGGRLVCATGYAAKNPTTPPEPPKVVVYGL